MADLATTLTRDGSSVFAVPDAATRALFVAPVVRAVSWVDIYEADNTTLWRSRAPILGGNVAIDGGRAERRNIDVQFYNDGTLPFSTSSGLWYDKILKPFVGVNSNGINYVTQLGEFMIDRIDRPHFPNTITVTGRDFAKKLLLDKFPNTTTFSAGTAYETVIRTIATNGGITKFNLSPTGKVTPSAYTFERGTDRWKAIADLAAGAGHELFFDAFGYLTLRPFRDPATTATAFTFTTGSAGNMVSYRKMTEDTRMRNHVVVVSDGTTVQAYGEASNTRVDSPTRIARLGRRTEIITLKMIDNNTTAATLAAAYLRVMALEQYEISVQSTPAPWLECGDIIEIITPIDDPSAAAEPTKFLLTALTIPLALGAMSATGKRVHLVG